MKRILPLCLLLLLPLAAVGQTVPHFTTVLVPLYYDQPIHGAYGSVWITKFSVYNSGTSLVQMGWCSVLTDSEACVIPGTSDSQIAAGATATALPAFSPYTNLAVPGRQLHFQTASDDQLSFGLRVADMSRNASSAGTEIPIIRERDYRRGVVNLPNIPTDSRFRLTLRLYEMTLHSGDFTIRVYDQTSNALLGSSTVYLVAPMTGAFRFEPAYLQLGDLSSIVPASTPLPQAVRVEITPSSPDSRYWGFISITNNETHELTLITPQ